MEAMVRPESINVDQPATPVLTTRFQKAIEYAAFLHTGQMRKGSDIPYIAHLLGVTALVLEEGGDEDEAIAALLHDAVEDQGGQATLEEIRKRFGARVARIVEACSDSDTIPKPPWRERKERYIAHIRHAPPEVRRVSLADKLYNARAILADYRRVGERVWERFNGGKDGTLWYYRELAKAFCEVGPQFMAEELDRVVAELEKVVAVSDLHRLRLSFKPDKIKVLFVGESPPANGTFFYKADSNLYHYTQQAFASAFGSKYGPGEDFLKYIKDRGYYLDDLCLEAVNQLDDTTRRSKRDEGVPFLASRIREYRPEAIVVVMSAIKAQVEQSAQTAGLGSVPFHAVPFPAQGNQKKYVAQLIKVLQELKEKGIIQSG